MNGGDDVKLHNTDSIAEHLNLTTQRVGQLKKEGILVEVRPGLYNLKDTTRRYINYIRRGDEKLNYNAERAKLTEVKRKREELELREREKTLHESDDVERLISRMLTNFRSRLLSIPAKLSPILAKKADKTEIYGIMRDAIYEALDELSDYNNLFRGGEEDAENE